MQYVDVVSLPPSFSLTPTLSQSLFRYFSSQEYPPLNIGMPHLDAICRCSLSPSLTLSLSLSLSRPLILSHSLSHSRARALSLSLSLSLSLFSDVSPQKFRNVVSTTKI